MLDSDAPQVASDERVHATAVHNRILARWDDLPEATLRVARVVLEDPRLVVEIGRASCRERVYSNV